MSDRSERADALRRWICKSYCSCGSREGDYEPHDEGAWVLYTDAIAEIDRLRAEIERLRSSLGNICLAVTENPHGLGLGDIQNICRPFASETHEPPHADQNRALVAEIATRRGIVQGCPCGCRGDFYLTESDPYNVQGT